MLPGMISSAHREMAEAFGQRLRQAREQRGLSNAEVAAKLGLERSSISQYEAGRSLPSLPVLQKLSRLLCVSLDRLCFDEYEALSEIQDKELAARIALADRLPHQHRYLVIEFIDSLLARDKLEGSEGHRAKKRAASSRS